MALWQGSGWTIGALANHVWSVTGPDDRPDVSSTYIQPFVAYTTKDAWTFSLNTESTYDWESGEWSVPVNAVVSKLVKLGKHHVSIGAGVRYWVEAPEGGPEDLGFRFQFTILLPKK